MTRAGTILSLALVALSAPADGAGAELTVEEIIARHIEARGGAERWSEIDRLRMTGKYDAFSLRSDFTLVRQRPHLYRLDFQLLEVPAIRARGPESTWALHKLLQPEPTRIEGPDRLQMERESLFGPLLLGESRSS